MLWFSKLVVITFRTDLQSLSFSCFTFQEQHDHHTQEDFSFFCKPQATFKSHLHSLSFKLTERHPRPSCVEDLSFTLDQSSLTLNCVQRFSDCSRTDTFLQTLKSQALKTFKARFPWDFSTWNVLPNVTLCKKKSMCNKVCHGLSMFKKQSKIWGDKEPNL